MCNPLIFISSSAGAILPFYCPFLGSFPRLFAFLPILFRIFHYCIHCMYRYTFLLQMFDMARLWRFSQNVLNTCMPNMSVSSCSVSAVQVWRETVRWWWQQGDTTEINAFLFTSIVSVNISGIINPSSYRYNNININTSSVLFSKTKTSKTLMDLN